MAVHEVATMVEVRPMEVDAAMTEVPVAKVPVTEVPVTEMTSTTTEASAETAAMTNFDGQIIGQIFGLGRGCRIDQRHRLRALGRLHDQHQPRHGEEAKQSSHQSIPSLDPEVDLKSAQDGLTRFAPGCRLGMMR
jgi:hypothetical protein